MSKVRETTVSVRWIIPFLRVTDSSPSEIGLLAREGIGLREFVDPDTRIRHRAIMELLARAVKRRADPELGLRAGERVEPGDYGALEYAARTCANVREAILCACRYQHLMHGGQEARLLEDADLAIWQWRVSDGVAQLSAANDFSLVSSHTLGLRYSGIAPALREVHFLHETPTSTDAYRRVFGRAKLKFAMPYNALVFARSHMDASMSHAHAGLHAAYQAHAEDLLRRLDRERGVAGAVRGQVIEQLRGGDIRAGAIARRMAMSHSTLSRRLAEEGTSHREIVESVRRELAYEYLADRTLAISEVAFLLGFSHVTTFYRAFERWSADGTTPAAYRATLRGR